MKEYADLYSTNQTESSEALAAKEMTESSYKCRGGDTVEVRHSTGRLFHVAGLDTGKSWRLIIVLVRDMLSFSVSADRKRHLPMIDILRVSVQQSLNLINQLTIQSIKTYLYMHRVSLQ